MSVRLFCLVKGKKITNAFSVKISRDEPISELKKVIKVRKQNYFAGVDAYKLRLWKVEIGGDHLDDQLKNFKLNDSDELIAIRKISEYFVDPPAEKHVHVLVEPLASTVSTATSSREQELLRRIVSLEERLNEFYDTAHIQRYQSPKRQHCEVEQERNVKKIRLYPSPSSFALLNSMLEHQTKDQEFLIGRPCNCVGAPLDLYNSVFYDFKRYYDDQELAMDNEHYNLTLKIIELMANFYSDEDHRERVFHEEIRELFGQDMCKVQLDDKSSNVRVLTLNFHTYTVLRILIEIKNEIGTGGSDPTTQAAASYAKFYAQKKNEKLLKGCNMPCFIIGLAGPWICVLGAVYVEKPIVQHLTCLLPLVSTYDQTYVLQIARLFKALRLASDKLKDYYYSLPITTIRDEDPQRFYPYHCEANNVGKFFYTHRLFDNKLLWRAETEEGSHQIVVKYTRKYNKHAHELCFGIKKAPRLLSVEMICGFYCVVMDYIEGRRLSECDDLKRSEYVTIIRDIEETILYLHSKDIVFADLRDSNILVFKDESSELRGMLIDFDWAGVNNVDRYPPLMNPNINWPDGARDHMPLDKKHDLYWLNWLKKSFLE